MRAILTYHSLDDSGSPISVSPETFRAHVRFLASGRVRVVPLGDLLAMPDEQEGIALTFDDGFLSFASLALPLLEGHGLPATVFVVSEHVGRTNAWGGAPQPGIPVLPLMDWETLGRARERGVAIGAHTRRHPDLTAIPPAGQLDEIAGGAAAVTSALGAAPDAFAYPFGRYDDRVAELVRERFAHACTTELRVFSRSEDPVCLPRLDAWYFRAPGQLEGWGSAAFRRRVWLRASGRRVKQLVLPMAGR